MAPMVVNSLKQIGVEDGWEEVGKAVVQSNRMKCFGKPEIIGYLVTFLI